jgi:hypothetical protein
LKAGYYTKITIITNGMTITSAIEAKPQKVPIYDMATDTFVYMDSNNTFDKNGDWAVQAGNVGSFTIQNMCANQFWTNDIPKLNSMMVYGTTGWTFVNVP